MTTWTDPKTWVTGELVNATALNTHLRDNLIYLKERGAFSYVEREASYNITVNGVGTTGWLNVDTANLTLTHNAEGGLLMVGTTFICRGSLEGYGTLHIDIEMDGARLGGPNGLHIADDFRGVPLYQTYHVWTFVPNVSAGLHTFRLQWILNSIIGVSWSTSIHTGRPVTLYVKEFGQ